MKLETYRRRVDRLLTQLRAAKEKCRQEREELNSLTERQKILAEAQALAQSVAEKVQNHAHKKIADLVTKCLTIFDEPYTFRIIFAKARGRTEARLVFERDGLEVDPLHASGGGVVDVAAFALRVACLILRRPPLRRVLLLDEPFRFVDAAHRPQIRALLESLARDLKIQFIMVTHDPALKAGKVVEL